MTSQRVSSLQVNPNDDHQSIHTHEGEFHNDNANVNFPITRSTYLFVMCAAINSCNLGYDIGVSTDAGKLIQEEWDLSRTQREIFVGSINFWAMFGGLFAHYFTDGYGRRYTFVIAAIGFIFGILIMVFSQSYGVLLFGRFFVGLGVGVGLAVDPMYIAEVSPAKHRGKLVTYSEIALNVGIVFGFSSGLILASVDNSKQWRFMFLLGAILPMVMIFLVFTVMPESPRWLVAKDRPEEAREILKQVYPAGFDVGPVIEDIQESIARDKAAEKTVGWGVIFRPTPGFRRMLMVGVGTAVAQQAVGIDAIQYYLLDLIEQAGFESEAGQDIVLILLGLVKLIFIFVGGKLFDKSGRRPLLFTSLLGMAVSLLFISIGFFINSKMSNRATMLGIAVYLAFFSIGMGPGAWLIPSEVFAPSIRAKAMGVATLLNRATATLMSSTFLSTANLMGWSGFFLLLCCVCMIVFGFLYVMLPETKGRTLEDMSVYFAEITGDDRILEAEATLRQGGLVTVELSEKKNENEII